MAYIIQILTATVMKYHVSVDCQESYIFPRGYIFPKRAALRDNIITRENITILAPPTRDISSVPVNICYIRWSKWMISSKFNGALWLSWSLVTRLGVCVQTMWTQTWQLCALSIMTFYCLPLRTQLARCVSLWVNFLIWNYCYCCCCFIPYWICYIFPVGEI